MTHIQQRAMHLLRINTVDLRASSLHFVHISFHNTSLIKYKTHTMKFSELWLSVYGYAKECICGGITNQQTSQNHGKATFKTLIIEKKVKTK